MQNASTDRRGACMKILASQNQLAGIRFGKRTRRSDRSTGKCERIVGIHINRGCLARHNRKVSIG